MRKIIDEFFTQYLVQRDLEATLSYLTESVISIGTGAHEIATCKAEFRALLEEEFKELPTALEYEILNYTEVDSNDSVKNVYASFRVCIEPGNLATEFFPRFTGTCVKIDENWKISSMHMSVSSSDQGNDTFFPLHYGKDADKKLSPDSDAKLMELISQSIPGGIMGGYLEEGFPLYVINNTMLQILGYTYEELIAETNEKMINTIHPDDRTRVEESITQQFNQKGEYEIEYRAIGKNHRVIWVRDIGKKVVTQDGRNAMISIMSDISDRIQKEQALTYEAERDSLTTLHNRKKAMKLIEDDFKCTTSGMMFICDVDNFKSINDSEGHAVGDQVLRQLASIIENYAGELSVTARLGGDEYVLYFPETIKTETAVTIIKAIQEDFVVYMKKIAPHLNVSLSVGGVVRHNENDVSILYKRADDLLYRAKMQKGTIEVAW